ncbi:DEAD/DEAH box helicase domain-containing protein [Ditylenchus destructor]|uniref:RNA helicase n=1 Tax=Ditylenchus destructor TaxID=166010 RepID=A0AAD4QS91_9BILA|nr:DEAD/DEAH box helicase domain-containing protein [Ditylenchus destructor]
MFQANGFGMEKRSDGVSGNRLGNFAGTGGSYESGNSEFNSVGHGYGMGRDFNELGGRIEPVNWGQTRLQELKKNIYRENDAVKNRSQIEVDKWIQNTQVTLQGSSVPRPVFEFSEANFSEPITKLLYANYECPTPIQSISWPVALSGRDMISIARTGSGKTLGFLLPGIMHTLAQPSKNPGDGPTVVVILPTRELAQQVEDVARDYCRAMNLGLTCVFGGVAKGPQGNALRQGVEVCVATPGRLLDFIQDYTTNMRRCSYLVLDEADRMLDMGFEPQIRKIVSQIRPDRQTLMFSATWPRDVRQLASDFQKDAVFLNVGSLELAANHNIKQIVEVVQEHRKKDRLIELLSEIGDYAECKTLVFVETKRKADNLTYEMRHDGWPVKCIHGDKSQYERDYVMNEFREGKTLILIATDVAARGLDITDIKFVINYDYPKNSEDYVHRIGRTARRDQSGVSYTFFNPENASKARDLIKVLEEAKQNVPQDLANLVNSSGYSSGGYGGGRKPAYGSRGGYGGY